MLCGDVVLPYEELCEICEEYLRTAKLPAQFGGIIASFAYDGAIRDALRQLKFMGNADSVSFFAARMAKALGDKAEGLNAICYVPLHSARQKIRGYNQSELLAHKLAEKLELPLRGDVLIRLRDTPSQREFDREGRRENVRGAFEIPSGVSVEGLRLLLIDDITTTGATLLECARALAEGSATEVVCAAAAATAEKRVKGK